MKFTKYVDILYLSILCLVVTLSFYYHFADGNVLSVNNYLAFLLLVFVIIFKIAKPNDIVYGVFGLLLLCTFNVINFSVVVINATIYHIND